MQKTNAQRTRRQRTHVCVGHYTYFRALTPSSYKKHLQKYQASSAWQPYQPMAPPISRTLHCPPFGLQQGFRASMCLRTTHSWKIKMSVKGGWLLHLKARSLSLKACLTSQMQATITWNCHKRSGAAIFLSVLHRSVGREQK